MIRRTGRAGRRDLIWLKTLPVAWRDDGDLA
jgi:hypothetical protein